MVVVARRVCGGGDARLVETTELELSRLAGQNSADEAEVWRVQGPLSMTAQRLDSPSWSRYSGLHCSHEAVSA